MCSFATSIQNPPEPLCQKGARVIIDRSNVFRKYKQANTNQIGNLMYGGGLRSWWFLFVSALPPTISNCSKYMKETGSGATSRDQKSHFEALTFVMKRSACLNLFVFSSRSDLIEPAHTSWCSWIRHTYMAHEIINGPSGHTLREDGWPKRPCNTTVIMNSGLHD